MRAGRPFAVLLAVLALAAGAGPLAAQVLGQGLHVKYVRDSEEYVTLARMIYHAAEQSVMAQAAALPRNSRWAVALDVDETALDNSTYELERVTYHIPFADPSWDSWVERAEAGAVPGVRQFVDAVRARGGRVAWISNRSERTLEATRANMAALGLYRDGDLLCLKAVADSGDTKPARRNGVVSGAGSCAWPGEPVRVLAWVGDQMGDFPAGEESAARDLPAGGAFGSRYFLLPNPMYGRWTTRVTRPLDD